MEYSIVLRPHSIALLYSLDHYLLSYHIYFRLDYHKRPTFIEYFPFSNNPEL